MNEEQKEQLAPHTLAHYIGTTCYYRHPLSSKIKLTEGAYHCTMNGLSWFFDIVATEYFKNSKDHPFQTWELKVDQKTSKANIICTDGNGSLLRSKNIDFTDYPYPEFKVWVSDAVIMLPSEY